MHIYLYNLPYFIYICRNISNVKLEQKLIILIHK